MYKNFLKYVLDFVISLVVLIIILPLLVVIAIAIKLDSKGTVFYVKERLGKDEKPFLFYKFRTMTNVDRNQYEQVFEGNSEITRVGSILRRTKMDELPQLFNVLKGDMSIVGPRPCLPKIKEKFGEHWKERFKIKPGLTSLAATKGSIYLTFEDKGYWDMVYVKQRSFFMDIDIIFKTVKIVLFGEKKLFKEN